MRTPEERALEEKAFLEMVSKMSDRDQKGMLESMQTFNRLPPEQRTDEMLQQILISNGFSGNPEFDIEIESQLDPTKLNAATTRLRTAIATIVLRHRTAGDLLTWRLLYAIEEEVFQELAQVRDLDTIYVDLLKSSPLLRCQQLDELVDFRSPDGLPSAFSLMWIWKAYQIAH